MKSIWHILSMLCLFASVSYAQSPTISKEKYPHDGHIRLYIYHTDTFADLTYLKPDGSWDEAVYQKINFLLRSYTDDKITSIDKRLIELADHLQDHFAVDTVEVISGYRSPDYNKQLKETGHNVANESFHTQGLAMDVHLDEIPETILRDYLHELNLGGVGYYGNKLMVHMDFGPEGRSWEDGAFEQNTEVGLFNAASKLRLRTNRFYYAASDFVQILGLPQEAVVQDFEVQHFFRGKWSSICQSGDQDCVQMVQGVIKAGQLTYTAQNLLDQNQNRFGKYRVFFDANGLWQNSNEFYIKR